MSLKTRLLELEKASGVALEDIHVAYFVIGHGGIEPIGYRSDSGEEILRKLDESEADFKTRCYDAVYWPVGENSRHIFKPIYAD
jgi:hypothetical protein